MIRIYPSLSRTPNLVKSLPSIGDVPVTVAPRRLRRMGITPNRIQTLPNYGTVDGGGVRPWIYYATLASA